MNIAFNSSFFLQERLLSPVKEKISSDLTGKQKVVIAVALLALALLVASLSKIKKFCGFKASKMADDESSSEENFSLEDQSLEIGLIKESFSDEVFIRIFKYLNLKEWSQFANTNRYLNQLSKNPEVMDALLDSQKISLEKRLELSKQAQGYLKKMSFAGLPLTRQTFQEVLSVCPNIEDLDLSFQYPDDYLKCNLTVVDFDSLPQLKSLNLSGWAGKLHEEMI